MQTHFRLAQYLGLPVATNVVKVDASSDSVTVECEREAGTIDVDPHDRTLRHRCGQRVEQSQLPDFSGHRQIPQKTVRKIGLAELAIQTPTAGMQIEELVPAVEQRTPKALTGSAADIAAQIVDILKNEAKVI
jgi:electron transfer flavoprotein alpha/beta subunit